MDSDVDKTTSHDDPAGDTRAALTNLSHSQICQDAEIVSAQSHIVASLSPVPQSLPVERLDTTIMSTLIITRQAVNCRPASCVNVPTQSTAASLG